MSGQGNLGADRRALARVRAAALVCALAAGGAAFGQTGPGPRVTRLDPRGDNLARRTDPGGVAPIDPGNHALPDLLSHTIGPWTPQNPTADLFTGQWRADGLFFRLDLVFDGLVNPPGPIGCCGQPTFAPFKYGPNPVMGYIELDVDGDVDTGGEIEFPNLRYLGNVARYGGLPQLGRLRERAARDRSAFDGNVSTPPQVERSGEDFHLTLVGWEIDSANILRSDPSDWLFGPGETWWIQGYLFQRAHGYRQFSSACCRPGAGIGSYEPFVTVQFAHLPGLDQTMVSLVYPLTNAGSAAQRGDPSPQQMDIFTTNQNSILEGLHELRISALAASPADQADPAFALMRSWGAKTPDAFLDPAQWRITVLVGGAYAVSLNDSFFVWSDIHPNVRRGDFDGNGLVDSNDVALFNTFLQANDGRPGMDDDDMVNGRIRISGFARNFCLFDLNADGVVDGVDAGLITAPPPFAAPDFDQDEDVDLSDFGFAQGCLTGPDLGPPAEGCEAADLDHDGDVDRVDLNLVRHCVSGAGIPANPQCGHMQVLQFFEGD